MARKLQNDDDKLVAGSQGKDLPETTENGERAPAVTDLPPANPLGEPMMDHGEYPNISEAGKQAAALGIKTEETDLSVPFGETIVEHPVSPTDTNPNPHGQRSDANADVVVEVDKDTKVSRRVARDEDDMVEVTGLSDEPVHVGDGRTIAKDAKVKVTKDHAKILRDNKQVK